MKHHFHGRPAMLFLCLVLGACAQPGPSVTGQAAAARKTPSQVDAMVAEAMRDAAELEARTRVNANWSVNCTVDQVSGTKRCFAGTFGRALSSSGDVRGTKSIPFQVFYVGTAGPFVGVGWHTYPGRRPLVRVDENEPVVVNDSGGVAIPAPDEALVEELRVGRTVRARYDVWPEGARDMYVELEGFEEAWRRLQALRDQ